MDLIPVFPSEAVLFPRAALELPVLEPRWAAMLRHCLMRQEPFGVLAVRGGPTAGPIPNWFSVGTLAQIEEVTRLPGGRRSVLARGGGRFRIRRRIAGGVFFRAEVDRLPDLPSAWYADSVVSQIGPAYRAYRRSVGWLGLRLPEFEEFPTDPERLSWAIGQNLVVELVARQQLLEERRPLTRLRRELTLLRREATFIGMGLANRLVRPPSYTPN